MEYSFNVEAKRTAMLRMALTLGETKRKTEHQMKQHKSIRTMGNSIQGKENDGNQNKFRQSTDHGNATGPL